MVEEIKKDFDVNKNEWNQTLAVTRKKLFQVFIAGATVATVIWAIVFLIYQSTGFRL